MVVKLRPDSPRLAGCVAVQRHLHAAGYPCPEPLAGPAPLGWLVATAEAHVPEGEQLPARPDRPALFARALADLVRAAPPPAAVPSLDPAPPWAWPDAQRPWPPPDDLDADLNTVPGPAALDRLAAEARATLLAARDQPRIVGHVDFESQNVRWIAGRLHVVHDWDSVAALPEPVVAGVASAVFTASGLPGSEPAPADSEEFLRVYVRERHLAWSDADHRLARAAGVWVRAFNAKKAYVRGDVALAERLLRHTSVPRT